MPVVSTDTSPKIGMGVENHVDKELDSVGGAWEGVAISCLSCVFRVCVWGPKQVMRLAVPFAPVVPPGPQFVPASVYLAGHLGAPLPAPLAQPAVLAPGDLLYAAPLAVVVFMHVEVAPVPVALDPDTPMDAGPVVYVA